MDAIPKVKVCVGSSCHIKGARKLIMKFDETLKRERLEKRVELAGSFCMERCGEGLNWEIDEEPISSPSVESAMESFMQMIVHPLLRKYGKSDSGSLTPGNEIEDE